jgi:hypothetical protein
MQKRQQFKKCRFAKRLPQSHSASEVGVTDYSQRDQKPSGNASGHNWESNKSICLSTVMQDEPLTVDECDELAEALRERAASLPNGSERENLLKLAECFRELANIKRLILLEVD